MALEPKKVGKAARKLRNFLKKNSRHVTPEEIHRLRTTIRKLEAAVDAVLPKPSAESGLYCGRSAASVNEQARFATWIF